MAKAIRRLNGPGLALLILLLPAIVSSPGSRAQAQTGGQRPEGMIIHPDGVIDIKQLPPDRKSVV